MSVCMLIMENAEKKNREMETCCQKAFSSTSLSLPAIQTGTQWDLKQYWILSNDPALEGGLIYKEWRKDEDRKTTDKALLSDKQTSVAVRQNEKCGIFQRPKGLRQCDYIRRSVLQYKCSGGEGLKVQVFPHTLPRRRRVARSSSATLCFIFLTDNKSGV